ncbi:hypothetical protein JNM87_01250 [Candidatus Saccharibacteria bacterium]|nr:hypothetical protein [Candidatus Saccharibacteria bacterium]
MNTTYTMHLQVPHWLSGQRNRAGFVCDESDDAPTDSLTMDARARSGDYFADLAARLESIVISEPATASLLDHIIYELSYIDRRYEVTPKSRL